MFKPIGGLVRLSTRTRFQYTFTQSTRTFLTSSSRFEASSPHPALPSPPVSNTPTSPLPSDTTLPIRTPIGKIQRRLQITFTCTATIDPEVVEGAEEVVSASEAAEEEIKCGHRSTHEFSKRSYDHGIVLIECPGCKNRHLIGQFPLSYSPKYHQSRTDTSISKNYSGQPLLVFADSISSSSEGTANRFARVKSEQNGRGFDEREGRESEMVGRWSEWGYVGAGGIGLGSRAAVWI